MHWNLPMSISWVQFIFFCFGAHIHNLPFVCQVDECTDEFCFSQVQLFWDIPTLHYGKIHFYITEERCGYILMPVLHRKTYANAVRWSIMWVNILFDIFAYMNTSYCLSYQVDKHKDYFLDTLKALLRCAVS